MHLRTLRILIVLAPIICLNFVLSCTDMDVESSAALAGTGGDGDSDGGADSGIAVDPGQLTAGEWRDLDNWDYWKGLVEGEQAPWADKVSLWEFETIPMVKVGVSFDGSPSVDVKLELLDASLNTVSTMRTDNQGSGYLFPKLSGDTAGPYQVRASTVGQTKTVEAPSDGSVLEIELQANSPSNVLDLMFVIDTTGSMADELTYLQSELTDVLQRVQTENGHEMTLRFSVNFYRDEGDDYVVRPFQFTENLNDAIVDLNAQQANGGGDYPEAVEQALDNAIESHDWSASARARLLFLVLDAPPHKLTQIIDSIHGSAESAQNKGIRIIPVAASGVDKDTEFLLRFLDVVTGGTYAFLTDHSGIGNSHIEPTIGQYELEYLNDLLVRVINGFI